MADILELDIAEGSCIRLLLEGSGTLGKLLGLFIFNVGIVLAFTIYACWYCRRLSTDVKSVKPVLPSLSKMKGGCFGAPAIPCCDCTIPGYTKPEEYFITWFWTDCIYTWPWCPREGEPKLTRTDRFVVTLMVMLTDLAVFLLCTYGIGRFWVALGGDDSTFEKADTLLVAASAGNVNAIHTFQMNATNSTNVTNYSGNVSGTTQSWDEQQRRQAIEFIGLAMVILVMSIVCVIEDLMMFILTLVFGIVHRLRSIHRWVGVLTLGASSWYSPPTPPLPPLHKVLYRTIWYCMVLSGSCVFQLLTLGMLSLPHSWMLIILLLNAFVLAKTSCNGCAY